jgi:DNA-binding NarL/FixJ family response regulator
MGRTRSSHTPPVVWRIAIVDNHPLVRRGLTALIDGEPDLTVCAAVAADRAGLEAVGAHSPDLVIADFSLDRTDCFDLVSDIHLQHEELPVLVLSMYDAPQYAHRAFRAGASGYVSKQEVGETLIEAIHAVLDGQCFLSPKIDLAPDRRTRLN